MKEKLQRMLESGLHRRELAKSNYNRAMDKLRSENENVQVILDLLKKEKESTN